LLCWKALRPEIALSSNLTAKIRSESDWDVATEIFVNGDYDAVIVQALRSSSAAGPLRVLDLGANVGFFSLRCIQLYGQLELRTGLRLVAVEASSHVFAELQRRFATPLEESIELILKGGLVGPRSGRTMFRSSMFSSHVNGVARSGRVSRIRLLDRYAEERAYVDLEEFVDPHAMIDLIKCDIEGSELDFVSSYQSLLQRTRLLVIELHPFHCDVAACRDLLRSYGFAPRQVVKSYPTHSLEVYERQPE
jgi:FkbM family methyltransferase